MTIQLLGMSGSLRQASCNRMLLREAARLFGPASYTEADLNLPLYHGDLESASGVPDAVHILSGQIAQADAVLISTPEYNKGVSGVLKNALDWVSRTPEKPWRDKPVAVMSASGGRSGGERAQAMLRSCLVAFQPHVISGPELHLADCSNGFNDAGRLVGSMYETTLQELMQRLQAQVAR